jgi:hypothetical protein
MADSGKGASITGKFLDCAVLEFLAAFKIDGCSEVP